jgi:hypothetical protein
MIPAVIRQVLAGAILCVIGADTPALGQAKSPTWTPGVPQPNLTGYWKWDCRDNWGVKIEPAGGDLYSVSFCGPGGCFEPGQWTPNSPIFGDDAYRVLSGDTIEMHRGERVDTLYLCPSDERAWKDTGWGTRKSGADATPGSGIHFKEYGKGLPDLDENPPFSVHSPAQATGLWAVASKAHRRPRPCSKSQKPAAGAHEICGSDARKVRMQLREIARGLPKGDFARLWTEDLDGDGQPELLAQYDTVTPDAGDRYAAFFCFWWRAADFRATSASWFLEGSLHAVRPFGPTATRKVFVRHLSCTECEPWVYLTAMDLLVSPKGAAFEFTYKLEEEASWDPEIEYALPGMGHSIEAKVETRLPTHPSLSGPHLLQYFQVEDGQDEWWSFSCRQLKCTPTLFKGEPSESFLSAWRAAKPL